MQSLFEWDFYEREHDLKTIVLRNLSEFAPGFSETDFAIKLAEGTQKNIKKLDKIIEVSAPEWPIDKLPIVDRNVLRIGLHELLHSDRKEVPPRVAINEAIELAKTYGGINSGRFINGVMGTVYREIGEPDKKEDAVPILPKDTPEKQNRESSTSETEQGSGEVGASEDEIENASINKNE